MKKIRVKSTQNKVKDVIELHEKMKKAYFFTPPYTSEKRRSYEQENSLKLKFKNDKKIYSVEAITECSSKNVYFKLSVYENGKKKDVRILKRLV